MRDALSVQGYAVEEAEDGLDALEQVQESEFDAILLDMQMPKMDGWAFLRSFEMLEDQRAQIVVCSALVDLDPRVSQVSAAGFLSKPFALSDLYECMQRCMG